MNTRPDSNEYLPLAENTSLLSPKVLLPKFCSGSMMKRYDRSAI